MKKTIIKSIDYNDDWDLFNDDIESMLKNVSDFGLGILTGSAGLWNGRFSYELKVLYPETFIKKVFRSDLDYVEIIGEENKIRIKGIHHDGINLYELTSLKKSNKELLQYIIKKEIDEKDIDEIFSKNYGCKFLRCPKYVYIQYIEEQVGEQL